MIMRWSVTYTLQLIQSATGKEHLEYYTAGMDFDFSIVPTMFHNYS
jgi:hypothetical protein